MKPSSVAQQSLSQFVFTHLDSKTDKIYKA